MTKKTKAKLNGATRSWTMWFNGVLLAALPLIDTLKDTMPQLQPYVTPDVYKWMGLVVVIGNIILRFKTNAGLDEK